MKLEKNHLRKLALPIAMFVGLSILGGVSAWLVVNEHQKARRSLAAAEALRTQNETRLRQVSSEEQEIKTKSAIFREWTARGIVGAENRLDWVELLRDVRDRHKLLGVDYEIQPQQKIDPAIHGYQFVASTMKLDLALLHEEDLLRLLADLRQRARALVMPRECTVSRTQRIAADRGGPQAQLRAECTLQWITVREPEKKS